MKRFLPCAVAAAALVVMVVAAGNVISLPSQDQGSHATTTHTENAAPNGAVSVSTTDTHPAAPGAGTMPMGSSSSGTAPSGPGTAAAPGGMPMPGGAPSASNQPAGTSMPMPGGATHQPAATAHPGSTAMTMPMPTAQPGGAATPMPMPMPTNPPVAGTTATPMPMPMPTASSPAAGPTATPMPMPMPTAPPIGTPPPVMSGSGCSVVPNGQANPSDEPEPMGPIWCFATVASPTTRTIDAGGGWIDNFDTNVQMGRLNDGDMGYRLFDTFNPGQLQAGTFINNNHWMVDIVDVSPHRLSGGLMLTPNRSFRFENGKLVVEVDAAAGQDGMGGADVFYEIDITPAANLTYTVDNLYGYGMFGGVGALGCRLERADDGGHTVCSMYDNSGRDAGGTDMSGQGRPRGQSGRTWETQGAGSSRTAPTVVGGHPGYVMPGTGLSGRNVFRICNDNQMDVFCRDRFRFEFTKTSVTIFVNGYKWFDIQGLYASNPFTGADNRIPDSWISGGVNVYFTSWINGGQHTPTRFHWGRVAVNPHSGSGFTAPSAAPSFCLGQPQNTCPMTMH